MRLKLSAGAGETIFARRAVKKHFRTFAFALPLALATLAQAHADNVVFDGSSWSATTNGSNDVTSTTTGGATTLTAGPNVFPVGFNAGSDWVNLSTPITANSGIWTLNVTATADGGNQTQSVIQLGFGSSSFVNTLGSITSFTNAANPPGHTDASLGNVSTGPYAVDLTGPGITNNGNAAFHKGDGGATLLGGPFSPIQGAPESATVNFKMVLNTDGPNWTLEWFKDGVRQSFQGPNGVVNELVYNTNPAALNQFGISLIGTSFGPNPISETFSGISLTDSQEVAAVPEPSTWAMMMLGFAGLGLLSYRRTRRNGGLNFRIA